MPQIDLTDDAVRNMMNFMYVLGRRDDYLRGIIRSVDGVEIKKEESPEELRRRRRDTEKAEAGKPVSKIVPPPSVVQQRALRESPTPFEERAPVVEEEVVAEAPPTAGFPGVEAEEVTAVAPTPFETATRATERQERKVATGGGAV